MALVMADVSGKGVPAALFMAVGRTVLRNFSVPDSRRRGPLGGQPRDGRAEREEHVHHGLLRPLPRADRRTRVRQRRAPAALGGAAGWNGARTRCAAGPLVGVLPDAEYGESRGPSGRAKAGAYTDAPRKTATRTANCLGEDGLRQIIAEAGSQSVEDACRLVLSRSSLRSSSDQDDVTVLALRRGRGR